MEKIESSWRGGKPFNAEPYLRFSAGPFAPYFRGMIPDVNSLAKLDPVRLRAAWMADVDRIANHYNYNADQRSQAAEAFAGADRFINDWFGAREFAEKRRKYVHELAQVQKVERDPEAMSYQRERAADKRKDLDRDRRDVVKEIDARGSALREAVAKLATPEQVKAAGPSVPPPTTIDLINLSTTYGLWVVGLFLMLGLFTRLSALAGAVFLAQIYLAMPPWPGLPPNPLAEGHYYIVNKNLVEMLALLALAALPTGHWVGLDALLFGRFRRRRLRAAELAEASRPPEPSRGIGRRI